MANTPRYSFVQPSPWLPAMRAATSAFGGIMQESAASEKQKARLRSMASLLGRTEGFEADSAIYEQMALAETPDYGTAALTGKATTRDLTMPFEHALKLMEAQRERQTKLEVAGMRSSGSGVMTRAQGTAVNTVLSAEVNDLDNQIKRNEDKAYRLTLQLNDPKTDKIQKGNINDELERLESENVELSNQKREKQTQQRENVEQTYDVNFPGGDKTSAAPATGSPLATKTSSGGGRRLDTAFPDQTPVFAPDETARGANPSPGGLYARTAEDDYFAKGGEETVASGTNDLDTSEGAEASDALFSATPEGTEIARNLAPEVRKALPVEEEPVVADTSPIPPSRDLTGAPISESVLQREMAAQKRGGSIVEREMAARKAAESTITPEVPVAKTEKTVLERELALQEERSSQVGKSVAERQADIQRKKNAPLPSSAEILKKEMAPIPEPQKPGPDASLAAKQKYRREKSIWDSDEELRSLKEGAISQLPPKYAIQIAKAKTVAEYNLALKQIKLMDSRQGFENEVEANKAGENARAIMKDGEDFSVYTKYDPKTGQHNYGMVKKDDADKTDKGFWHINRGPYKGQIFYYNKDKKSIRRVLDDGTEVEYRLKSNPNADIKEGEFESWISQLEDSPLGELGIIPVHIGGSKKEVTDLEGKGAIVRTTGDGAVVQPAQPAVVPNGKLDRFERERQLTPR